MLGDALFKGAFPFFINQIYSMNGRISKKIRKQVYKGEKEESAHDRGYTELLGGTLIVSGDRRLYKQMKTDYIRTKRLPSG